MNALAAVGLILLGAFIGFVGASLMAFSDIKRAARTGKMPDGNYPDEPLGCGYLGPSESPGGRSLGAERVRR